MSTNTIQYDFRDRVVVITGASGGIGSATARRFAESGAFVILHANKELDTAKKLFRAIAENGGNGLVVGADFARSVERSFFLETALRKKSGVDVWVNAAGVDLMDSSTKGLSFDEKMQQLFAVDVFATIEMSRRVGDEMKKRGKGAIFCFGWDGVQYGWQGDTAQLYGAAKGAIQGFCQSLAEDLAPSVRVACLSLGWIKTHWGKTVSEEFERRLAGDSLRGRWGTPEDVAEAVLFLSSDAADYVDGGNIRINGGKKGTR